MATTTITATADAGFFSGANANTNFGSDPTTVIGNLYPLSSDVFARYAVRFPLSEIPADATVISAEVTLWSNGITAHSTAHDFAFYRLLRTDWAELEINNNRYKVGSNWAAAGGLAGTDYTTTDGDAFEMAHDVIEVEENVTFSAVAAMVQTCIDADIAFNGLCIGPEATGAANYTTIRTRENTEEPTELPTLVVVWDYSTLSDAASFVAVDEPPQWAASDEPPQWVANMSTLAQQLGTKAAGATLISAMGFSEPLDNSFVSTVLEGTPTVTAQLWSGIAWVADTTGLTIGSPSINAAAITVRGVAQAIGEAIRVSVSAGTAGRRYLLTFTADTDGGEIMVKQGILNVE